jgi:hypothetical protein
MSDTTDFVPVLIVPIDVAMSSCIAEDAVSVPGLRTLLTVKVVAVFAAMVPVKKLDIVIILVFETETQVYELLRRPLNSVTVHEVLSEISKSEGKVSLISSPVIVVSI